MVNVICFQKLPFGVASSIASSTFGPYVGGCRTSSDCPAVVALSLFDLRTLGTVGANLHLSTPAKVLERLSTTGRYSSMDTGKVAGSSRLASATAFGILKSYSITKSAFKYRLNNDIQYNHFRHSMTTILTRKIK